MTKTALSGICGRCCDLEHWLFSSCLTLLLGFQGGFSCPSEVSVITFL